VKSTARSGLDRSFEIAFVKSQLGGGAVCPPRHVFVSVRDRTRNACSEAIRTLTELGFKVIATSGTQRFLNEKGPGRPHPEGSEGRRTSWMPSKTAESSWFSIPPRGPGAGDSKSCAVLPSA